MKQARSIRRYFIRLIAPTSILFSVFVVTFIIVNDYRVTEEARLESQKLIFQSFVASIRQPLIQGSFVEARIRSKEMLQGKEIACIEINSQEAKIKECGSSSNKAEKINILEEKLLFSEASTESFAEVKITFDNSDLVKRLWIQVTKAFSIFIALGLLLFGIFSIAFKRIRRELEEVLTTSNSENKPSYNFKIREFQMLSEKVAENVTLAKDMASSKAALEVAEQVAHDIRSPVASLSILINRNEKNLEPELAKALIQAANNVQDIANDVLNRHRKQKAYDQANTENMPVLVNTLLQEVVSEKRINNSGKNVEILLKDQSNFCFVKMSKSTLRRSIANLIENAIQAIQISGKVTVLAQTNKDMCEISIMDNGCGIEESLLSKIIEKGGTFGKAGGSGLGLSSAKKNVEDAGGSLLITSKLNVGTTVRIYLPLIEAPSWIATEINLAKISRIKVVDDERSMVAAWGEKLKSASFTGSLLFVSPSEIDEEVFTKNEDTLYLMDYDIKGYKKNGIEIISEKGIFKNSILVTGHFDDESIRKLSNSLGLKILPKTLIENIAMT